MRSGILLALLLWCIIVVEAVGQAGAPFLIVEDIQIEGNNKTRTSVVLREMTIKMGDTISRIDLASEIVRSEELLVGTSLFTCVHITYTPIPSLPHGIRLLVSLDENWFLYPIPYLDFADRNFNVWLEEHNASLDRLYFGLDLTHTNLTGNRDKLSLELIYGYSRRYELEYSYPYLNRSKTLGGSIAVSHTSAREVNYGTVQNKQAFYQAEDDFAYRQFSSRFSLSYRPGYLNSHHLGFGYGDNKIDEVVVLELNPDFFLNGRQRQQFFFLSYSYRHQRLDNPAYPLNGNAYSLTLEKDGLGFFDDRDALTFFGRYNWYEGLSKKFFLSLEGRLKYSLIRTPQPYNDNRALGFSGNNLRGYEYYIVDGMDMGLLKSSVRFNFLTTNIEFGKIMPVKSFRSMPIKLYLSLNNDVGYVNQPYQTGDNPLNGTLLWGGGLGLDMVFFYDKAFRIEYSRNRLGEDGVFFDFSFNY